MIQAVTIDFWGTLLLDSPAADERYRRERVTAFESSLSQAGLSVPRPELDRAYAESGRYLGRVWKRKRDVPVEEQVMAVLRAVDPSLPGRLAPDVMANLVRAYAVPALNVPPTFDQSAGVAFGELRGRGLKLAVVSNTMRTPGRVLRQILARHGLLEHFDALTFSDECGIRKPDPAIFSRTLAVLGIEPDESVHVGDDPVLDVRGAQAAGMRVIQVSPDGRTVGACEPDGVITWLSQLPAALDELDEAPRRRAWPFAYARQR